MNTEPNPFHVLGLPVDSTAKDIVRRARELRELVDTEECRRRVGAARRALIRDPAERRRHEILEVPGTDYRTDPWEGFRAEFRDVRTVFGEPGGLDGSRGEPAAPDIDLGAAVDMLLAELIHPARRGAPPIGAADVLFG